MTNIKSKIVVAALALAGIAGGATACGSVGGTSLDTHTAAVVLQDMDHTQVVVPVYETNLDAALQHCTQDPSTLGQDIAGTAGRIGVSNLQVLRDLVDHNQTQHGKIDCGKELDSW